MNHSRNAAVTAARFATACVVVVAQLSGAQEQRAPVRLATIDGVVADTALNPLQGAVVSIVGSSVQVQTNSSGRFRISIPVGEYKLLARRIGFEPELTSVALPTPDTVRLAFSLERSTVDLDTLRVAATHLSPKMIEFNERRAKGEGKFLTQEEIDRRNSARTLDVMRTFTGVKFVASGPNLNTQAISSHSPCQFDVMVDGMPYSLDLNRLPTPSEVSGIEMYTGESTIPLKYKRAGPWCGLILIWTRVAR